MLINMGKTQI